MRGGWRRDDDDDDGNLVVAARLRVCRGRGDGDGDDDADDSAALLAIENVSTAALVTFRRGIRN